MPGDIKSIASRNISYINGVTTGGTMGLLVTGHPILEPGDREWIQALRRQYDPNYLLIEPHFTLIFEISDIGPDELAAHIRPICQASPKIEFNLNSAKAISGKDEEDRYLFLVPDEGYSTIMSLHDRLYAGDLKIHLRSDIPYIPHITAGVFKDINSCEKTADRINLKKFSIRGTVENLDIISAKFSSAGQERLETVERISLGV
jgi:hypothetical protein